VRQQINKKVIFVIRRILLQKRAIVISKMKNYLHVLPKVVLLASLFVLLFGFLSSGCRAGESVMGRSTTYRCGNDLVFLGDSVADVMLSCGEPSHRHVTGAKGKARTVKRKNSKGSEGDPSDESLSRKKKRVASKTEYEEKVAETWYDNRGSNDFVYSLRVEGGVLTKIVQGNRGK